MSTINETHNFASEAVGVLLLTHSSISEMFISKSRQFQTVQTTRPSLPFRQQEH
jgi:hypothetical protein